MRKRAAAAIVSAGALTLLLATSAMAGGWANAVMDEPPNQPGGPGEPVTIGFSLLQHGVTPVDWGTTQIVLTNDATGQSVSFDARPRGAAGHWVAEISVPAEGTWSYQVRHELEIAMDGFLPITVGDVGGTTPTTSAGTASSLALQPALLVIGAFLALLAMGSAAVGVIAYRRSRLDRARA